MNQIDGVVVTPLRKIPDERGCVCHMLRNDSPVFKQFGEIYFSVVNPGVVKGWHLHKLMTLNYAVISGMIKLVLYDGRPSSRTFGNLIELFIGADNYCLVTIPPYVYNGTKCISQEPAIIANCATIPHDPTEIFRLDPFSPLIPYNWEVKHG